MNNLVKISHAVVAGLVLVTLAVVATKQLSKTKTDSKVESANAEKSAFQTPTRKGVKVQRFYSKNPLLQFSKS